MSFNDLRIICCLSEIMLGRIGKVHLDSPAGHVRRDSIAGHISSGHILSGETSAPHHVADAAHISTLSGEKSELQGNHDHNHMMKMICHSMLHLIGLANSNHSKKTYVQFYPNMHFCLLSITLYSTGQLILISWLLINAF